VSVRHLAELLQALLQCFLVNYGQLREFRGTLLRLKRNKSLQVLLWIYRW